MKEQQVLRRCKYCANNCPLDTPKCARGEQLAAAEGIYETVQKKSRLKSWLEQHTPPKGY